MWAKKILSMIMVVALVGSIFASVPISAVAPEEKVEIVLQDDYGHVEPLTDDLFIVGKGGLYGLYSISRGFLTEIKWQDIYEGYETLPEGFLMVRSESGIGIIDYNGNEIITADWDWLQFESGVIIGNKNGLYGVMDINGNLIVEPLYDSIGDFYEGFAVVYKDGKAGYINSAGRVIVEPVWADAQDFSDSAAAVKDDNGLWGFIDKDGKTLISCKYENASSFANGYAAVLEDDIVYIIDKSGNRKSANGKALMLEPVFNCAGYIDFVKFGGKEEDIACIKLKGETNYCYIDNNFNVLTDSVYKYNVMFNHKDYAITIIPNRFGIEMYAVIAADRADGVKIKTVLKDKKLIKQRNFNDTVFFEAENRLYDVNGNDLFGIEFERYIYHDDNSDIINAVYKGQYVCVSFSGEVISPLSDYQFYYVNDNLYMATADDGRVKLCDRKGEQIAYTDEYTEAYVLDGVIFIKGDNGKWGLCDTDGKVILDPQFDQVYGFSENMLKYKSQGKYGFYNMETGEIIKPKFTRAGIYVDGYCWVSEKVLIGTIDKDGKYIISPLYYGHDDCTGFGGNDFVYNVTSVQKGVNGKYGVINDKGEKLTDFEYDYITAFNDNGAAIFSTEDEGDYKYGIMKVCHNTSEIMPTQITTDKSEIITYVGCYDIINEKVTPSNATNVGVLYTSTNPNVATVDEVGRVYGVSEGNAFVLIVSKASTSVIAAVNVKVEDRELHADNDIIPTTAWEEQNWLSDIVINRLAELGTTKTVEKLTYGDLLEVIEIKITEFADTDPDKIYHIPSIIGEFANLMSIYINPEIFAPLISTMPDSTKFLSNLGDVYINNTYDDEVDEDIIRNNKNGIPDANFYKALDYNFSNVKVNKNYYNTSLRYSNINSIKGISLLQNNYGDLDLSYNNITDISELKDTNFSGTVDLRYNKLDLTDTETLAAIESLEKNGCTVLTDGQNEGKVLFYPYMYDWISDEFVDTPESIRIAAYAEHNKEVRFALHGFDSIEEISITSSNGDIVIPYVENHPEYSDQYVLSYKPTGIGKASIYFTCKGNGKILCTIPVTVTDSRFFMEDIEISYYIYEWEPYFARILCKNDYRDILFRKKGETEWQNYYYDEITQNAVYEFKYVNYAGMESEITELNIEGIRSRITEKEMPDESLRNCFGDLFVGYKVAYYLYAKNRNINNLKGLSLLDFSENEILNFSYNYITDISELANLNLHNVDIDLNYNKIDFTLPHNAAALRKLYQNGCKVYLDNQFAEETIVLDTDSSVGEYEGEYNSSFSVYNAEDVTGVTLSLRDNTSFTDLYCIYNEYSNDFNFGFKYEYPTETQYIDVLYKGEVLDTLTFYINYENERLEKPIINISGYSEVQTQVIYNCHFQTSGEKYEYRKQGEADWKETSEFVSLSEEGIYEFRYMRDGIYSEIAAVPIKKTERDGLVMMLVSGGWKVYKCNSSEIPENLVIPESIQGYPVTAIQNIYYCYNLKSVVIPKTVESIGDFYGCSNLATVTISADNPNYYSLDGMIINKELEEVCWISPALSGTLTIPEGIELISAVNYKITKLILPASLRKISNITSFSELKDIEISSENPYLYAVDGVVFERYTGTLIGCPVTKKGSYTVPEGTLFIGDNAFEYGNLTEIKIPSSVIKIGSYAFSQMPIESIKLYEGLLRIGSYAFAYNKLKEIYIPASVVCIESYAFFYCDSLKKVLIPKSVANIEENILLHVPNEVIYCFENSYAHSYALEKGYSYKLMTKGDLNDDDALDAYDLVEIKKCLLEKDFATGKTVLYDLNNDATVNILDFICLKRLLSGA